LADTNAVALADAVIRRRGADAVVEACLAAAAACGAAHLARVNLGMLADDERLGRAAEFAEAVARW
jgi:hypothetical protein